MDVPALSCSITWEADILLTEALALCTSFGMHTAVVYAPCLELQ